MTAAFASRNLCLVVMRKTLLRRIRRTRDITLEQLQRATGVHMSQLSQIERGILVPSQPQANAIAGYFGRPIDELLADAPAFDEVA